MRKMKMLAVLLVFAVLLSACGNYGSYTPVAFSDMQYTRPDTTAMEQKLALVEQTLPEAESAKQIMEVFYEYYYDYEAFITNYYLAYIHYCLDLTDIYWETEYNYCLAYSTQAEADYDRLLYALADCPYVEALEAEEYFGPGFFDLYQGESMWDDTLTELIGREDALLSKYYTLSAEPAEYSDTYFEGTGREIAEVFVELIALRQEIAAYAGYPDYPSFAYDFYHYRDYTAQQALVYMEDIRETLVPLYREAAALDNRSAAYESCSQGVTLAYVMGLARNMGGQVKEAYDVMVTYKLYDITQSENKYDASFEVFLYGYGLPFVFVNSSGQALDKLTLTHEFGHFCNDYAAWGSPASVDVSEIFSQGLEYLSLFYANNAGALEQVKMDDSLCVYVEQAAYASFEHQVYSLTGDDLTVENVDALFSSVMTDFGLDIWGVAGRAYVLVPHFFITPMYVISYVVSNDAALQLYQLEKAEAGAGLEVYENSLGTQQIYFLAFLEEAGLESPFADGRLEQVEKTLRETLLAGT